MPEALEVSVPLLNPNEPEAQVAALHVREGAPVEAGAPLCTLETTKTTMDVTAARAGYVVGLRAQVGETLRAGEPLCWIADAADWEPPQAPTLEGEEAGEALPAGLRITQPALALARQAGLDLAALPRDELVTEATVRRALECAGAPSWEVPERTFDPRSLLIYGGGGHGKSLVDLVRSLGMYDLVGIVDDGLDQGFEVMGLKVLGGGEALADLHAQGVRLAVNAVGGVGDIRARVRVFERILAAGFVCPTLVHPTAFIEPSARLADGVQVFPHAYVGSAVDVRFGAIVNTGAVVSHDCRIGAYANVAPGALLAGAVTVGEAALIGMGVTVNLGVTIGAGARVGNSAVIKQDVPPGAVVRAGAVWP